MNGNIKQFGEQNNLRIDTARNAAYGNFSGYNVALKGAETKEIRISFGAKEGMGAEAFNRVQFTGLLMEIRTQNSQINDIRYEGTRLECTVKDDRNMSSQVLHNILNQIVGLLRDNGMTDCCRFCENNSGLEWIGMDGDVSNMCGSCFQRMSESHQKTKGNLPLGIIGLLGGGLIGVAAWIIIYQFGYIAGIAGFLMFYCSLLGYQKLGKKNDVKGIVLALVVSIIMLAGAEYACAVIEIKAEIGGSLKNIMKFVNNAIQYIPEVREAFIKDLVVGYVLMAVATLSSVIQFSRRTDKRAEMVRL